MFKNKINEFLEFNSDPGLILLNKELYRKILFIESEEIDSLLTIVDDNDDFLNLYFFNKGFGYSFNIQSFFFRSNLTDEIFFSLNFSPFYNKYPLFLLKLNKLLFCLEKYKSKSSKVRSGICLIFLKPARAGYRCSYIGIIGVLYKRDFLFAFSKLKLSKIKLKKMSRDLILFFSKNFYFKLFRRVSFFFTIKIRSFKFYRRKNLLIKKLRKVKKKKLKKNLVKRIGKKLKQNRRTRRNRRFRRNRKRKFNYQRIIFIYNRYLKKKLSLNQKNTILKHKEIKRKYIRRSKRASLCQYAIIIQENKGSTSKKSTILKSATNR